MLAVDSSTSVGWVTLARIREGSRVEILSELSIKAYSHAESLLPAIHTALEANGVALSALRFLVFGDGPGSFTGLRIGASVVSGLAFGVSGRVLGVASHAGIACAYASTEFFYDPLAFTSAPSFVQVFSDGGDTLISSTFRIFNESTSGRCCELLALMAAVNPDSIVCSPDTVMIGSEGLWKGRVPIPGIKELVNPDKLPISTGLILALNTLGNIESFIDGRGQLESCGFVTDATNRCEIRYGQPVKAMTLLQRRGW